MENLFESSDSVRTTKPLQYAEQVVFDRPHPLEHGGMLAEIVVVYETYGTLDERRDNAVLICHALSGDSHVAAHDAEDDPGWWEIMVGPGKPIDTDRYFVICPNCLGGCRGTTGPDSIDPTSGKRYGMAFPNITIGDIVEVQRMLIDHLGIDRLLAVVGGSLGGLMTLEWSIRFPDRLCGAVPIATGPHLTSQALAFDIVARNAIMSDPRFENGQYHDKGVAPSTGLAIARMLGHITYLSFESMRKKFDADRNSGRSLDTRFETKFSVGSYLAYQGDKFVERFDANSYLTLSMAMDQYDLGATKKALAGSMRRSMCRWLVLSYTTDWLFPAFLSRELVDALLDGDKRLSYCNVECDCGHDAFLLPNSFAVYGKIIKYFLRNLADEYMSGDPAVSASGIRREATLLATLEQEFAAKPERIDYKRIMELIPPGAKVLDLGCGKGGLLARLRLRGHKRVVGIEQDEKYVLRAVGRGLDVIQADLNLGLANFFDKQFDFVVLSKTLQTVLDVEFILDEMLRVGTRCIVSFPNLGYREHRRRLSEEGRAPRADFHKERLWYNTKDVRFLTIADFEEFCTEKGLRIHQRISLDTEAGHSVENDPNLNADTAIMVLSR
ncbi:MAG TPA: homoserine O-acetyltransferase [Planctomycetaceae bacterium]|nr:homoserine O-acetyltransferase [Planctomycetaceae bacterium]